MKSGPANRRCQEAPQTQKIRRGGGRPVLRADDGRRSTVASMAGQLRRIEDEIWRAQIPDWRVADGQNANGLAMLRLQPSAAPDQTRSNVSRLVLTARHQLSCLSFAGSPSFVALKTLSATTNQAVSILPSRSNPV